MNATLLIVIWLVLAAIIGYLLGGIPFAIVLGKALSHGVDVREHGSGNTGATNVVRVLGWRVGVPVFIADILKGTVSVLIAWGLLRLLLTAIPAESLDYPFLHSLGGAVAGVASVVGHSYSPYLHFSGGKSVSTTLGVGIVLMPWVALCALSVFALLVAIKRIVSIGSICAMVTIPIFALIFYPGDWPIFAACLACALLVIIRHTENIRRLRTGDESTFSAANVYALDKSALRDKEQPEEGQR